MTGIQNLDVVLDTLLKMRAYFSESSARWAKHHAGHQNSGEMCIGTAAVWFELSEEFAFTEGRYLRSRTFEFIKQHLGGEFVQKWNDCETRTYDEVIAMLDGAITARSTVLAAA